jgi:hypothetical protein
MKKMNLLICSALLCLSGQTLAFTLVGSSNNKGFQDPTVTILVNQSSCPNSLNLRRLIEDAVKVWNGIPTSKLVLKVGEDTGSTTSAIPPVAYCDPTMTGGTLGQGGGGYGPDGYISAAFIRVNTNPAALGYILNQSDTQQVIVVAHELGHMIGLGHTDKDHSLMHYSIGIKTDLALSQDDIDGASYLYPRNELGSDKMLGGCGALTVKNISNPPTNTGSGIFFYILCLVSFIMPLGLYTQLRLGFKGSSVVPAR